ncbi:MAG: Fic family protein [Nitrospirae bacterium]|nr:Fic family protein [Nitrospirota bacterium]
METHRSGPFTFRIGVDLEALAPLMDRVADAHERLRKVPVLPGVVNSLEREVLVSSVFGTNTIEGGTLTEEETARVLDADIDPARVRDEKERRVANIDAAYREAERRMKGRNLKLAPSHRIALTEAFFLDQHRLITEGLTHPDNVPGQYRDNPRDRLTRVGDADHGGVYTPPKCLDDIRTLMAAFLAWSASQPVLVLPPVIRAPLIHYYFERIHPFWDGNGRVGRVAEAAVMMGEGYQLSPFAMSNYYLGRLDEYFAVFRQAEQAEKKHDPHPNTPFVSFFLNGLLATVNRLHDRMNELLGDVLLQNMVTQMLHERKLNARQFTILQNLPSEGMTQRELRDAPWYQSLYLRFTDKTRDRDMGRLRELSLVSVDDRGRIACRRL